MTEIIEDLQNVPGVLGACLYHGIKGVLMANLPPIYKEDKLAEISKLLMRIHSAGRMNFNDITDLSLHYEESVVLIRELEDNLIIFTLCDPGFNQNLVTMSLNVLQKELASNNKPLIDQLSPDSNTGSSVENTKPAAPKIKVEPETARGVLDVATAPILKEMKSVLPKILGPMATFIFDETVENWLSQGGGDTASIESLLDLLAVEINDEKRFSSYREMIAPHIDSL